MALLQTGCLGVPEFLHQLQLQTQVGNGGRKRKMGEKKREKKKKNGRKQRENIKKNGRKQCNKEKERWEKTKGKKRMMGENNSVEKRKIWENKGKWESGKEEITNVKVGIMCWREEGADEEGVVGGGWCKWKGDGGWTNGEMERECGSKSMRDPHWGERKDTMGGFDGKGI